MNKCFCSLREKSLGDGCQICNPEMALEVANDRIEGLEQQLAEWRRAGEDVVSKLSRSQRSGTYQTQYTADADSIDHIAALLQDGSDE